MTPNEILAYCAGLIDGEGCVGAYNVRQRNETKSPYAQITVRVAMVTPHAVRLLHEVFGGRLGVVKKHVGARRQAFFWVVRNTCAESCLRALLPYLREKREQAEVALALADLRRARAGTGREPLTLAEVAERETFVQRLKDLKRVEHDPTLIH